MRVKTFVIHLEYINKQKPNKMPYTHKTGTIFSAWNSHKEHCFYEDTTKRQMFLIIQQLAQLMAEDGQDWVDLATEERETIKANGIK